MKKALTIIGIIVFSFGTNGISQEWAPIGAEWYYDFDEFQVTGYVKIVSEGDTIINGQQCKKLAKTLVTYNSLLDVYDTSFIGNEYTWSDTDKVYIYKYGQFYTLYNFAAQPGDFWTIPAAFPGYCDSIGTMVVDSIDNTIINNVSLRMLYCSSGANSNWTVGTMIIENIGPIGSYMLPEMTVNCGVIDLYEGGPLRCYYDDVIGLYSTGISPECDYLLSVEGNKIANDLIKVFPNPAKDYVIFELSSAKITQSTVKIFDISGQEIVTLSAKNRKIIWDTRNIKNGIYFYNVETGGEVSTGKIVLQK
jgi:hypothetical protein